MKILRFLRCVTVPVLCLALFTACTPGIQTVETTGANTTTTSSDVTTATLLPSTTVTQTAKPTVETSAKATTAIPTTTSLQTKGTTAIKTAKDKLTFAHDSEDYDILRRFILQHFPEEKNLDEFVVKKVQDNISPIAFTVLFTRVINECPTNADYSLDFDDKGTFMQFRYRNPVYDPTKVKPPRVATEKEIEQAKQREAEKVPEGCVVWEQTVSCGYDIDQDRNYMKIQTIYTSKKGLEQLGYLDKNSPNYGKTPPVAMFPAIYDIPR